MTRVGIGYDLHRLDAGGKFILGGVEIPHDKGFVAHSDGDVLAHAIIDALLGAAGLGNIGQRFPDTDPALKGVDSMLLLAQTMDVLRDAGWSVVNVDAVVVAERPKLNPHLEAVTRRLAEVMGMDRGLISVKPKTNEGVNAEGRGEAVSVQAVVLLVRN
ncbi:MAG: 2-C-methyl-D-erythritol 2,4-cyclodiphosphate synthase [Candidatus Hydrogenedens sp.]|nr:2-C-methyl-D-erythritol 2,4-cyclodiphosphate synthase [Candidatus Hydrogenedentota bacterium]NLF56395.1 2-C-methyl-D-erythritol 2,4-cyclodiphosphate synthase [Candidatus Hydrogenedens sp.]